MSAQVYEQDRVSEYGDRLIGRTRTQKEREADIRDDERAYWVNRLRRLGDGRQNRKATAEERSAFRQVAAMIDQNLGE